MTTSKISQSNTWQEIPGNRERVRDIHNQASCEVWTGIDNRTLRQSPGGVAGAMLFNSRGVEFTMPVAR